MAFNSPQKPQPEILMSAKLESACEDYRQFVTNILKPAHADLRSKIRSDTATLHRTFGANLLAAHSIDYLLAVRVAAGIKDTRKSLVATFDEKFSVPGAYLRNRKMELIDGINNGLKHIRLDPERYKKLGDLYGQISFRSLVEHNGQIFCHLQDYRFDYCRVVLLPALTALSSWDFESDEAVMEFAKGDLDELHVAHALDLYDSSDPSTAIDQMIELSNPPCANCEEGSEECLGSQYVFAGQHGQYEPLYVASESEIDELMRQISPSYSSS